MKRTIPVLTKADLRKFVRFCSESRASGDFEIHFGLGRQDIDRLKIELGIDTPEDAKEILKDVFLFEDKERTIQQEERKAVLDRQRKEADKRLADAQLERQNQANKRRGKVLNATKIKKQDQKRQERFDKTQNKTVKPSKSDWKLPVDNEQNNTPERFRHEIMVLGMRFVKSKYGVSKEDIIREASRLKLKIDFEFVPR
jgi:hypothetical protein